MDSVPKIVAEMREASFPEAAIDGWADRLEALCKEPVDGWVMVPREPTDKMLNALGDRMWRDHDAWTVWRSMIAAAPIPPCDPDEHEIPKAYEKDEETSAKQSIPVAFVITDDNINHLQVNTIRKTVEYLKHAHYTNLHIRINGQNKVLEADWIKHMQLVAPPPPAEPSVPVSVIEALIQEYDDGAEDEICASIRFESRMVANALRRLLPETKQ